MDFEDLAKRVRQGLDRNQVFVGKDLVIRNARSGRLGLIWITSDLGHGPTCKIRGLCKELNIPLLEGGTAPEVGIHTNLESCKVYMFKKEFSGLKQLLRQIEQEQAEAEQ